ncbi:MAG: hypothetical protein C0592_06040 [Marinilabiliales bacterium]|nr:MAG: hypothetical protein C0592_06040 [Marinilabiliales bacterium]
MKKLLSIALILSFLPWVNVQAQEEKSEYEVAYPTSFIVTPPLRDLEPIDPAEQNKESTKEMRDRKLRVPFSEKTNPDALPQGEDPALQKVMGTNALGAPLEIWTGQSGNGTPPDPTGAAGTNHYVQAVNSTYKVWNKTGGSVAGPYNLSAVVSSNAGDPIVMYDKFADRWLICSFDNYPSTNVFLAVSATNDPAGSYNLYTYSAPAFPDYLKFSIWTDGYYMTANFGYQEKVMVFERDEMIAGVASPASLTLSYNPPNGGYFFCPLAGFADGQLPAAGTKCPIFSYEDDGWSTYFDDAINIYEVTVDWGVPSGSIAFKQQLMTAPFDASYNSSWNDISQPSTSAKLDGLGGIFTYRAQHRVWTGYNSVVLNMGVKVSSSQRSIRWFELRQDQSTGNWSIYQEGTYAPDGHSRWCGSIAMDDHGGIGLAYSKASTSVSASIGYTARNSWDPLGQMTYTEEMAVNGSGAQTWTNRFGDYSHMSLDPSDGTIFWYTGEYIYSNSQRTKVFSFKIPWNASIEEYGQADVKAYNDGNSIIVTGSDLPNDEDLRLDLFDINGRLISASEVAVISGHFNSSISASELPAGVYLVRVGKEYSSFQRVIKVSVQ